MEAGVVVCVAGGRDVGGGDGIPVPRIEFVVGSGNGEVVIWDSASDELEHPTEIISRDNKNNRLI